MGMHVIVWSRRWSNRACPKLKACAVARSPQALAEQSDVFSVHLALAAETRGLVDRADSRAAVPGLFVHQHRTRRGRRLRGPRGGCDGTAASSRSRRVFNRTVGRDRRVHRSHRLAACVYGTHHIGASTDRRRRRSPRKPSDGAHVQGQRTGGERREPRSEDAGDAHAGGPTSLTVPACWRMCSRSAAGRQHQRAGDGERDFRRRAGGRRAHQPRRGAARSAARIHQERKRRTSSISI